MIRRAFFLFVLFAASCLPSCRVPERLAKGTESSDVRQRRETVVRLRAYGTADEERRLAAKHLLIESLDDDDPEVRRLAALGLANFYADDDTRRALLRAFDKAQGAERETLSWLIARVPPLTVNPSAPESRPASLPAR